MKDCTTCKYGYKDERLGIPMCHHPKRFSEDCVDFNMHEEEEIKESEKPIDIDFEQELYKHFGQIKDFTLGMRIAQYFYNLGRDSVPLPEDTALFQKGVEEGKRLMMAEWLKDRDGCFWDGVQEGKKAMKEQMLKEAVKCEYDQYPAAIYLPAPIPRMNKGDMVRVIVCKKED